MEGDAEVRGQGPTLEWAPNADGAVRSVVEAVEIARRHGVVIPGDVHFSSVPADRLGPDLWAKGPTVVEDAGGYVYWADHFHDRTKKIPFQVREDVFASDEAIVAVFAHEMYELAGLRELFAASRRGRMTFDAYRDHVRPALPGNLHDRAWEEADRLVLAMRGAAI